MESCNGQERHDGTQRMLPPSELYLNLNKCNPTNISCLDPNQYACQVHRTILLSATAYKPAEAHHPTAETTIGNN
eukprot:310543-Amphidinium_carterae.1